MGEPYHAAVRWPGGGSLIGKLQCVDQLGDVVNLSSRGFGLHARVEASFHLHAITIPTTRGDGASFSFWEVDWSGHGRFWVIYPWLHALALDPRAMVQTVWDAGWLPSLPSTLSDQRYEDLLVLHTALVPLQLSERAPEVWVWSGGCFSVCAVYYHIQDLESTSDSPTLLKCCHLLKKWRIPLKIKLFGWLLLHLRLMTWSLR